MGRRTGAILSSPIARAEFKWKEIDFLMTLLNLRQRQMSAVTDRKIPFESESVNVLSGFGRFFCVLFNGKQIGDKYPVRKFIVVGIMWCFNQNSVNEPLRATKGEAKRSAKLSVRNSISTSANNKQTFVYRFGEFPPERGEPSLIKIFEIEFSLRKELSVSVFAALKGWMVNGWGGKAIEFHFAFRRTRFEWAEGDWFLRSVSSSG